MRVICKLNQTAKHLAEELLGIGCFAASEQCRSAQYVSEKWTAIAKVTATDSCSRLVNLSRPYYLDGTGLVTKIARCLVGDVAAGTIAVLNVALNCCCSYTTASARRFDSCKRRDRFLMVGGRAILLRLTTVSSQVRYEYPGLSCYLCGFLGKPCVS